MNNLEPRAKIGDVVIVIRDHKGNPIVRHFPPNRSLDSYDNTSKEYKRFISADFEDEDTTPVASAANPQEPNH